MTTGSVCIGIGVTVSGASSVLPESLGAGANGVSLKSPAGGDGPSEHDIFALQPVSGKQGVLYA